MIAGWATKAEKRADKKQDQKAKQTNNVRQPHRATPILNPFHRPEHLGYAVYHAAHGPSFHEQAHHIAGDGVGAPKHGEAEVHHSHTPDHTLSYQHRHDIGVLMAAAALVDQHEEDTHVAVERESWPGADILLLRPALHTPPNTVRADDVHEDILPLVVVEVVQHSLEVGDIHLPNPSDINQYRNI